MKILITGFGPFPGVEKNPTGMLLSEAVGNPGILADHDLQTEILPTTWEYIRGWVGKNLENAAYDLIVHLGLAVKSQEFRLESTGRNRVSAGVADQDGRIHPGETILQGGPSALSCPLPLASIIEVLRDRRGLPVVISDDAGGYLCNFLYALSLDALQRMDRPPGVVFLHVPWILEQSPPPGMHAFPLQTHLEVLESLIGQMLKWREG